MSHDEDFSFCKRDTEMKWNGWGWKDSYFYLNKDDFAEFTGDKYEICHKVLPKLPAFMADTVNASLEYTSFQEPKLKLESIPSPVLNEIFIEWLKQNKILFSIDPLKRVNRSHGHTVEDMVHLRLGECAKRIPDIVVFPKDHNEVVEIVKAADQTNAVIIPIGGGTSVSGALKCPQEETRCIVSLDVCRMKRILWIDEKNLIARAECGILGGELEQQLNEKGYTIGHEPDSMEFSSLGGWVATRASGIKKNKYGNIEDLVVHVTMVTPVGVLQKCCTVPRISAGPDIHHFIMGSEGTLGVITEITFKICALPECKRFGSILFPTFENGVEFLREVARRKWQPTSIRLMDNAQFQFGSALKPQATVLTKFVDFVKMFYVTKWKRFSPTEMSPVTLLFEGSKEEVSSQEKRIYNLAKLYEGIGGGQEDGRYGYMLTFTIAYIRDFAMDYRGLGESFETSVPWDKVLSMCRNVKEVCLREAIRLGVKYPAYVSCRVTQLYDSGACVYFYYGFNYRDVPLRPGQTEERVSERALEIYELIEEKAREEILAHGGSISHHHGVGKLRKRWLPQTVGDVGLSAIGAIKSKLDPNNIFACGNLLPSSKL